LLATVTKSDDTSVVAFFLGDGTGKLALGDELCLTAKGTALAAGDLNDDNRLDLVVLTPGEDDVWSFRGVP
jgi:hypothetical protein